MGPLGALHLGAVTVDGAPVAARLDDQTILVPLGGVLPADATAVIVVPFSATLRSTTTGSSWLFTRANGIVDLYRWIPWISRRTPFDRPNHGDPFVTPVSPRVTLRLRTERPPARRVHGRADGDLGRRPRHDDQRRSTCATSWSARPRTTGRARSGSATPRSACMARPGFPAAAVMRAATAARQAGWRRGSAPTRTGSSRSSRRPAASAWRARASLDPHRRGLRPTSPTSSPTRSPTSGSTASWATTRPASPSRTRRPPTSSPATSWACAARPAARRADLDRSIYRYSRACYYEVVYIQGGNLLAAARTRMGSTAFWAAIRGYLADHRWGLVHTRTLLDALDDATSRDLARVVGPPLPPPLLRPGTDARPCTSASRPRTTVPPAPPSTRRTSPTRRSRSSWRRRTARRSRAGSSGRSRGRRGWSSRWTASCAATPTPAASAIGPAYDWAAETTVYVDRAFQGRGLGRAAMRAVLAILRLQGFHAGHRRHHAAQTRPPWDCTAGSGSNGSGCSRRSAGRTAPGTGWSSSAWSCHRRSRRRHRSGRCRSLRDPEELERAAGRMRRPEPPWVSVRWAGGRRPTRRRGTRPRRRPA